MPSSDRPTLRDIAAAAGVSAMTVSLALRDSPRLKVETRQRIKRLAQRMGYVPDPHVSSLMAYLRSTKRQLSRPTLGYVHYTAFGGVGGNPLQQRFHDGARQRAASLGYGMDEFELGDGERAIGVRRLNSVLYSRGIKGLCMPPPPTRDFFGGLRWDRLATATCTHFIAEPAIHRSCHNHLHGMRLALRELERRRYHRIGYVGRREIDARVDEAWLSAYLRYQFDRAPAERVAPLQMVEWDEATFLTWFDREKPDAVITIHLPVLDWIRQLGLKVPQEVGFVHIDWSPRMGDCAGIDQCTELVGAGVVDLVVAQLGRNETGIPAHAKTVLVEGRFVAGSTVRPV